MAALVWTVDGQMFVAHLNTNGSTRVGREGDIHMSASDGTVSRRHAEVRFHNGQCFIENLSGSNPLRVRGNIHNGPIALGDQDPLEFGTVRASYHDLSQARQLTGLVCSNCNRENEASAKDCWFCGQNMVNAPSVVLRNRPPTCRLVSADGAATNVFPNNFAAVNANGSLVTGKGAEAPKGAAAIITGRDDGVATVRPLTEGILLGGQPLAAEHALRDGEVISVGDARYLALLG